MAKVVIKECNDYELGKLKQQLSESINLLGGWDRFVSSGMKVLLKVNLIGPKTPDSAAVTHCEFVRALTQLLQERGCIVWIGDSSGGAIAGIAPTANSFKVSGLEKIAKDEGAVIKNFDREGVIEVKTGNAKGEHMYLAKPMFVADFVINLPKLKTHSAGIYTGAVKNLFGCVPGLKKAEYHRQAPDPQDLGMIIVDIHQSVSVGLHIMDGIMAMQGEGPTAGEVYLAKKILMSTDPVALDTVAAAMIGMGVDDIPILVSARERKLGESDLKSIEITGDYATPPALPGFKYPKRFRSSKKRNNAAVIKVIDFLKARPKIDTKRCKHCNMCVESCPVNAIDKESKKINYKTCIECMCCHELCLHKAIDLKNDNWIAALFMRLYRRRVE